MLFSLTHQKITKKAIALKVKKCMIDDQINNKILMKNNLVNVVPAFDFKSWTLSRLDQWDFDNTIDYSHVNFMERIKQYTNEAHVKLIHLVNLLASKEPWSAWANQADAAIEQILRDSPKGLIFQKWWWIRWPKDLKDWFDIWSKTWKRLRLITWTWAFKWEENEVRNAVEEFWADNLVADIAMIDWWKIWVTWWQEWDRSFEDGVKFVRDLWFKHAVVTDKSRDNRPIWPNLDIVKYVMENWIHAIVSWWISEDQNFKDIVSMFKWKSEHLYWVITWRAQLNEPDIVKRWQKILSEI